MLGWQLVKVIPLRAARIAQGWFEFPYPTFKRLALFAASQNGCIAPDEWVEWLMEDDSWCLWSVETEREMMRLLVSQARMLSPEARDNLEMAILRGHRGPCIVMTLKRIGGIDM